MIKLDFKKQNGLVPAIVQDYKSNKILMLAYMDEEALKKTVETGNAWYFSRTRNKLWMKGEQSGNVQTVKDILVDCDEDSIILKVEQKTAACHEGYETCFFRRLKDGKVTEKRIFDPKQVYK